MNRALVLLGECPPGGHEVPLGGFRGLLQTVVAEGILERDEQGLWQLAGPETQPADAEVYEALPLPLSLRELVGRRLEGLSIAAHGLAEAASVLGLESESALLQGVAGEDGDRFALPLNRGSGDRLWEATHLTRLATIHYTNTRPVHRSDAR